MPEPSVAVRRTAAVLAVLVPVGVLFQAVTAGGFVSLLFGAGHGWASAIDLHELGANATFGVLAVEGLLVLATPLRRRRQQVVSGVLVGVLLTAVIGLGYVGAGGVLLHVPLAVLAFGVACWHAAAANGLSVTGGR